MEHDRSHRRGESGDASILGRVADVNIVRLLSSQWMLLGRVSGQQVDQLDGPSADKRCVSHDSTQEPLDRAPEALPRHIGVFLAIPKVHCQLAA